MWESQSRKHGGWDVGEGGGGGEVEPGKGFSSRARMLTPASSSHRRTQGRPRTLCPHWGPPLAGSLAAGERRRMANAREWGNKGRKQQNTCNGRTAAPCRMPNDNADRCPNEHTYNGSGPNPTYRAHSQRRGHVRGEGGGGPHEVGREKAPTLKARGDKALTNIPRAFVVVHNVLVVPPHRCTAR
jgi:hypothetical protein